MHNIRMSIYQFLVFLALVAGVSNCQKKAAKAEKKEWVQSDELLSLDGPYIYDNTSDSLSIISVEQKSDSLFYLVKSKVDKLKDTQFKSFVNNKEKDAFNFSLIKEYKTPEVEHEIQGKIFVTSDIEGNFNGFYSLLIGNHIIDENYNWIFKKGHLVICGDMFDRGNEVIPALWLLYKLEKQAKLKGGKVHYILGNHDVMNLTSDIRYVSKKYIALAKLVSGIDDEEDAYNHLMSNTNELVKWIKSKNTIEKIDQNIFLHAGISQDLVDTNLSLTAINDLVRDYISGDLGDDPTVIKNSNLIQSRMGPLWYRGLVQGRKEYYKKASIEEVDAILDFYNAKHLIIGHTIVSDIITSDYNGKVIRVDIKHPKEKFSGKSSALLIENGKYYRVDDKGVRIELDF
jgi:hypothetical protein